MNKLSNKDLQNVISSVAALHQDIDLQTLTERTLAAASRVIAAADSAAFTGFSCRGEYNNLMWSTAGDYSPAEMEVFAAHIHENPLFTAYILENRTDTLKITDLMPSSKFERTAIYNEFYRRVGVSNQLVTPLQISEDLLITCSINIKDRDFSDRDKLVLSLLAPHLANAIRNAFAYGRLSGALETEQCGIIALSSTGTPVFISEFVRLLFKKYFEEEKCSNETLPETLNCWIRQHEMLITPEGICQPVLPLRINRQGGELTVRLAFNRQTGEKTLMLEEKLPVLPEPFLRLGLTKREAEILCWVAQGKTDSVIASLCGISLRTVHKHIQNIYVKLGVETRTSAMLKALEIKQ